MRFATRTVDSPTSGVDKCVDHNNVILYGEEKKFYCIYAYMISPANGISSDLREIS